MKSLLWRLTIWAHRKSSKILAQVTSSTLLPLETWRSKSEGIWTIRDLCIGLSISCANVGTGETSCATLTNSMQHSQGAEKCHRFTCRMHGHQE